MVICSDDYPKVLFIQQSRRKCLSPQVYSFLMQLGHIRIRHT
ncbi:hypothetical protein [Candidatus Symbiopectobacterium sp.]|nr:hypothetical protein [Candidatus Symbiopectobacterium sp.]